MIEEFTFRPLALTDIPLMHTWFNTPHVQQFYSLRHWTEDEVINKLTPYITGEKPVYGFIIIFSNRAVGYIQYYHLNQFPFPGQDLADPIIQRSAGIDFFIGNAIYINKGMGHKILKQMLDKIIWPQFDYCLVDPDIRNKVAIQCNNKVGFKEYKIISTTDALHQPVKLKLMILEKSNSEALFNKTQR